MKYKLTFKNVAIVLLPVYSLENQKRYFLLFILTLNHRVQVNGVKITGLNKPSHVPTQ